MYFPQVPFFAFSTLLTSVCSCRILCDDSDSSGQGWSKNSQWHVAVQNPFTESPKPVIQHVYHKQQDWGHHYCGCRSWSRGMFGLYLNISSSCCFERIWTNYVLFYFLTPFYTQLSVPILSLWTGYYATLSVRLWIAINKFQRKLLIKFVIIFD